MKLIKFEDFIHILFREVDDVSCLDGILKFKFPQHKAGVVGDLALHLGYVSQLYKEHLNKSLDGEVGFDYGDDGSVTVRLELKGDLKITDTNPLSIRNKLKEYRELFDCNKLNAVEANLFELFGLDVASVSAKSTRNGDFVTIKTKQWIVKNSFEERLFDVMLRVIHTGGIIVYTERTPSMMVEWRCYSAEDTKHLLETLKPKQPQPITVADNA